jgi:hypothetical protein
LLGVSWRTIAAFVGRPFSILSCFPAVFSIPVLGTECWQPYAQVCMLCGTALQCISTAVLFKSNNVLCFLCQKVLKKVLLFTVPKHLTCSTPRAGMKYIGSIHCVFGSCFWLRAWVLETDRGFKSHFGSAIY